MDASYTQENMHPPNPPHANKCTTQQAADYAACEGGDTSKCGEFGVGQPAQMCGDCIQTQKTDPTWGVVVFDNSIGTANIEGCVDDALMQVSSEQANGGQGSCGDFLYWSYGCQDLACGTCIGNDLTTCDTAAIDNACAPENKRVVELASPCHVLFGDAAPPAASSCFPDTTITDVAAQRADFLTRITEYMCGAP